MDLITRQFERAELIVDAELMLEDKNEGQVRFSGASPSTPTSNCLKVMLSDIASGGIGAQSDTFMPRNCKATIIIRDPLTNGMDQAGVPLHEVLFKEEVCIRRCDLMSRKPTYLLGLSFESRSDELQDHINSFLDRISESLRELGIQRLRDLEGKDSAELN